MALPDTIAFGRTTVTRTTAQASALSEQQFLDLAVPQQKRTNWCWAAVAVGIRDAYRGRPQTQCDVASRVLRPLVCSADGCVTFEPLCNQAKALPKALAPHYADQFTDVVHKRFPFIREEIEAGRPIAARMALNAQGAGHFVVISGYRLWNNNVDLRVWDPKTGTSTDERLTEFRLNYKQCGGWERSFKTRGDVRVPRLP